MKSLFAAIVVCTPVAAAAQRDTAATPLNTVVVTAERARRVLGSSTSSVSRISVDDIAHTPRATIADALRRVPGFALVDFDGLGFDPQLMVRGFYGGGEAEYVVMLVDGRPIAQLQNGIIPWAALPPLSAIAAIEVVRGSASALYGDAAIGGVINIITRTTRSGAPLRLDLAGSSFGGWMGNASFVTAKNAALWAGGERTDGYRDHAERSDVRGGATVPLMTGSTKLNATVGAHRQSYDEPGALLSSLLDEDRRASDVLFRFDRTKDRRFDIGLDAERGRFSGYLNGESRRTEAVRTLALAPGFGDTKERVTSNARILGSVQFETKGLVVGADMAYNTLDSKYFEVTGGDRDGYATATGERGDQVVHSDGSRVSGAAFAQYTFEPVRRVRMSIGSRFDWIADDVEHLPPRDAAEDLSPSHTAFSPKLGVSVKYMENGTSSGNVYVSASGSFKAPTLDQLFDQRPIPVPFDPFSLTTSNALLVPQRGANLEAGLYHTTMISSFVIGTLSLSAYQMDMRDEVDFNVETLSYVNIGKSRHRGVEIGGKFSHLGRGTVFANYTLQKATFRRGENTGNHLKAIPRHNVTGGVSVTPVPAFDAGVILSRTSGAFIDDANTIPLDAFSRVDAHASYGIRGVNIFVEVRNLLDKKYNTTGFVDPAGTGEIYFYPAAGRVVSAGVRRGW